MAAGKFIELDTREFEARLRLYDPLVLKEAVVQMRKNGNDLLREAGGLIPVDTGALLGSGSTRTKTHGQTVETTVGYNMPYATKVHYEMAPAPGSKMKQGPKTRDKQPTEFGEAGGLYLQRPLLGKMARYTAAIAERIKKYANRGS